LADFTSLRLFDAHRVGSYAYDWSPDHEDGRRCLDADEMQALGWQQDDKGRWYDPVHRERTRDYFESTSPIGLGRVRKAQTAPPEPEEGEEAA
jgi:hypothetical protein